MSNDDDQTIQVAPVDKSAFRIQPELAKEDPRLVDFLQFVMTRFDSNSFTSINRAGDTKSANPNSEMREWQAERMDVSAEILHESENANTEFLSKHLCDNPLNHDCTKRKCHVPAQLKALHHSLKNDADWIPPAAEQQDKEHLEEQKKNLLLALELRCSQTNKVSAMAKADSAATIDPGLGKSRGSLEIAVDELVRWNAVVNDVATIIRRGKGNCGEMSSYAYVMLLQALHFDVAFEHCSVQRVVLEQLSSDQPELADGHQYVLLHRGSRSPVVFDPWGRFACYHMCFDEFVRPLGYPLSAFKQSEFFGDVVVDDISLARRRQFGNLAWQAGLSNVACLVADHDALMGTGFRALTQKKSDASLLLCCSFFRMQKFHAAEEKRIEGAFCAERNTIRHSCSKLSQEAEKKIVELRTKRDKSLEALGAQFGYIAKLVCLAGIADKFPLKMDEAQSVMEEYRPELAATALEDVRAEWQRKEAHEERPTAKAALAVQ